MELIISDCLKTASLEKAGPMVVGFTGMTEVECTEAGT